MSNPYQTPTAEVPETAPDHLPPYANYAVVGNDVYVRTGADLGAFCFLTGGSDIVRRKTLTISCFPRRFRYALQYGWIGVAVAFLLVSFHLSLLPIAAAWCVVCLLLALGHFLLPRIRIQIGLSKMARTDHWKRVAVIVPLVLAGQLGIVLFGMVQARGYLPSWPPPWDEQTGFLLLLFLMTLIVRPAQAKLLASRVNRDLYRIENIPAPLLARLREAPPHNKIRLGRK